MYATWVLNAGISRRQSNRIYDFCNGQVSILFDPTERSAHFDIVDRMLVIHTMHARCLHTCICPLGGVISDFSVENPPRGTFSKIRQRTSESIT